MTILDGKNPRLFFPLLTGDGRWRIAYGDNGEVTPYVHQFLKTQQDAWEICKILNDRELAAYREASNEQALEKMKEGWPALEQIAASLGIKLLKDD